MDSAGQRRYISHPISTRRAPTISGLHAPPRHGPARSITPALTPRDRIPRYISRCTLRGAARTSSRPFPPVRRHHCHRPVSKSHAESTALQSHWGITPSNPAGLIATTFFDLHDRSQDIRKFLLLRRRRRTTAAFTQAPEIGPDSRYRSRLWGPASTDRTRGHTSLARSAREAHAMPLSPISDTLRPNYFHFAVETF